LQFQLQIESKDRENELLKADQAKSNEIILRQRFQNMILYIVLGFISVIAAIMWLNARKRRRINEKLALQTQQIFWQREEISKQNTDLSKRNQQLLEINHEKDTLMSIVAHDLKSPFNRIAGLTSLIQLDVLSQQQKEYLGHVKNAAQAGTDLIVDLLDAYALEAEDVEPEVIITHPGKLLDDRVAYFVFMAEAKGIALKNEHHFKGEVFTDPKYLHRILDNLISNAIKFSGKDTQVMVSGRMEEGGLFFSVKDEGPGFSEEDKLYLFTKFKKLSARPSAGESSNGLGLAIVKTLIDRLGGSIELISESKKGSEFIVRIPTREAE
jgi:signal transduction histidine kinase